MFSPSLLHQHINHAIELGYTENQMYIRISKVASDYMLKSVSFVTEQNPQWIKTFFWIPCEPYSTYWIGDNQFIVMLYHTRVWVLFWYIGHENFYS